MAFGQGVDPEVFRAQVIAAGTEAYNTAVSDLARINSQISALDTQIETLKAENSNLQSIADQLSAAAAPVIVSPVVSPIVPEVITPVVVTAETVAPTITTVVGTTGIAPAPVQPEVIPTTEAAAAAIPSVSVLMAGIPTWGWILVAGVAVVFLFGGKGLEGAEGKKPRRIKRRK